MTILDIKMAQMQFYKAPAKTTVSNQAVNILQLFELIHGDKYKNTTDTLRSISDDKERKEYKVSHFDFVTPSCTSTRRCAEAVTKHSSILAIDIDDYAGDIDLLKSDLIRDPQLFTLMAFKSPSGKGLKWLVLINLSQASHHDWFIAIEEYLKQTYHVEIDTHCKDVCRSCFLPHDEYAYINDMLTNSDNDDVEVESILNTELWIKQAKQHTSQTPEKPSIASSKTSSYPVTFGSHQDDEDEGFMKLVEYLKAHGINLTASYDDWTRIGLALANHFGEPGREIFHELSQADSRYNPTECDKKYNSYLRGSSSATTCNLATIFYLAKQQGIDLGKINGNSHGDRNSHLNSMKFSDIPQENRTREAREENEGKEVLGEKNQYSAKNSLEMSQDKDSSEEKVFTAPTFSDKVTGHLPSLLQSIIDLMDTPLMGDMMFFGAIPILCCILHFIVGIYDRRKVYPLWFGYLYAQAGSSKGILTSLLKLSDPIEAEIRAENEHEMEEYQEAMRLYNAQQKDKHSSTGEMPKEPPYRSMYLPANSSSSATYRALNNNHGWGLIFETEGDVLANALAKDYGDYSTGLRNGFHHEPIRMSRCANNEHITINNPDFSCLLSGTPAQVRTLLPSAENGLASRFEFYQANQKLTWRNVFEKSDTSLDEDMEKLGQRLLSLYHLLKDSKKEINFKLTKGQQARFNDFFEKEQKEFFGLAGWDIVASVRRLALSTFRLMMVFSACRLEGSSVVPDEITCTDEDFESCLTIMDILMQHTLHVFATLIPQSENSATMPSPLTVEQQKFLDSLGEQFTTKEYKEAAKKLHIADKTAEKLMNRMVNKYCLVVRARQGVYQKIHTNHDSDSH